MTAFRGLARHVCSRLEAGESKEQVGLWAYKQLSPVPNGDEALWWCHGLATLWLLALGDSELFPDLEFRFSPVLEAVMTELRQENRKTKNLEEYALWLQAQMLRFFWNGSSSDREITEIENLGKLILELSHENEGDFVFFSELAFPPTFIAQDWSSFQESRMKILEDSRNPPTSSPRRKKLKLSQLLVRKWSLAAQEGYPDSGRRTG